MKKKIMNKTCDRRRATDSTVERGGRTSWLVASVCRCSYASSDQITLRGPERAHSALPGCVQCVPGGRQVFDRNVKRARAAGLPVRCSLCHAMHARPHRVAWQVKSPSGSRRAGRTGSRSCESQRPSELDASIDGSVGAIKAHTYGVWSGKDVMLGSRGGTRAGRALSQRNVCERDPSAGARCAVTASEPKHRVSQQSPVNVFFLWTEKTIAILVPLYVFFT